MLPSFFRSAPAAPEVLENLWDFAQAAYLDNPLPSLFKERLFVYLSRFCEVRYCLVRHLGFLIGRGRPAGDEAAQAVTIDEAIQLLKRPAPSRECLNAAIARLETVEVPSADWPQSGSELDDAIFACAAAAFLEPAQSAPARRALGIALGGRRFELLIAYLAFIRTAHFWTLTHPDLELEPDLDALLRDHEELARLLFEDPRAGRGDAGQRLWGELQELRGEKTQRGLLEALPTPTYTTDALGRLTYYNKAAAELWGYRPELGHARWCGSWRLYWPDGTPLPHDECPMALVLRDGQEISSVQGVAERPDGSRVPFVAHPRAIRDESGAVVGGVNTIVDVSELKSAERNLRESERYARKLLDALPCALYTTDAAGRITYFNQAVVDLAGRRPDLGTDQWCVTFRLYHPDGRPMAHDQCPMALALRENRPIRGVEAIAERPDGTRIPFIPYPTPLYDDSGALIGGINMLVDITERTRAEHAARWLAAIVDSSHDAIVSKDLNGNITSWNSGAERLFGYTANEAIGKSITMVIPGDRLDEEPENLRRIRLGEQVHHYETVRMRKDGSLVDVSVTISPVKDANGRIIGASKIARDIGESKRAQARQELLTREIHHRTNNMFAVVQAVVSRSFAGKQTVEEAEAAVLSRLSSLAQTHAMLIDTQWKGASFRELVEAELSPYAGRVRIHGPNVVLNAKAAQNFGLVVHELATNAAKHGALSNATGRIDISWSSGGSAEPAKFTFRWLELGGPPVERPQRKGFGSIVLERIMAEYFAEPPQIDFAPSGVRYELMTPLEAIADTDQPPPPPAVNRG